MSHEPCPASQPPPAPDDAALPPPRVLLLGLGNDILTDDAVGLHVVRELQPELADHPSIDIRETTEMGLALLDFITGYRAVVIVDSIQTGKAPPGFLHELDAPALNQLTGRTPHFVGVKRDIGAGPAIGSGHAGAGENLRHRSRGPLHLGHRL